ncbi:hypothetical protein GGTG_00164 [Gaeumannomyces tritici R3-111a-1]|uniref:DUF7820 domain-containing protein n=1 Tax=Gaeumannomyces tritici (strain R3-111a-1) TaxID=644352 RepID=J3NFX0_GAET3|nr:hypothetical protein GGTG_00164 [Gaeumannomyces tritici R3-111a-1]EJT80160.1 hypothetical protein GGTG_00164 [Gaeumannomyces tritici R3-111a-1]
MENANPKNPEGDSTAPRRSSTAQPVHSDQDDAYLQAMAVQDGFRPTLADVSPSQGNSPRSSSLIGDSESPPSTPSSRNLPSATPPSRPSSIAKAPGPDSDSFALQNDGSAAPKSAEPATISSSSQESSDSMPASSSPLIATEAMHPPRHDSPYQGPSGPSHPYQLYTQDVRIARTMSTRTSSTAGPPPSEQPYSGPHGPAHPYGMYSQNTAPTPHHPGAGASVGDAVGFSGVAVDPYRRRIGPEGEEMGGLVGPDGHTEELPPYTRYPDEQIARKVRDVEAVQSAHAPLPPQAAQTASSTTQPALGVTFPPQPIPGAGGIGIAARNPEFDSIDDLNTPRSRHSSRSFTSASETSHHEINTAAAAVVSEKVPNRWEKRGRKRVCGMPCWVVVLLITAILVVGLILGAVLGTLLGRQPGPPPVQRAPPPLYDAVPIPVPSGLPPLPTGSFGMPLMPLGARDVCFQDASLAPAWTCGLAFSPAIMAMVMTISGGDNGNPYKVSMSTNNSLSAGAGAYSYGAQAPMLPPGTFAMQTVNDTLEPSRGPAWFKMLPFNKTVFISESSFPAKAGGSASSRRLLRRAAPSFDEMKRKFSAQPGDKPWACTWPDTVLEVFIYPNQNASLFKSMSSSGVGLPPPGGSGGGGGGSSAATDPASPTRGSLPFGSGFPSTTSGGGGGGASRTSGTPGPSQPPNPFDGDFPPLQPPYPRVVKLEERRIQGSPQPVCRQLKIREDGTPIPNVDGAGKPIEVVITEVGNTPPYRGNLAPRDSDGVVAMEEPKLFRRDNPEISDCSCVWFAT